MNERKQLKIKIDLLLNGVRMQKDYGLLKRPLTDSISDGLFLIIDNVIYVTVAINPNSTNIIFQKNQKYYINIFEENLIIEILSPHAFSGLKTQDSTMFENVGTFQIDRLRISAFKGCYYDILEPECKFCEVGGKKKQKENKIENIKELVLHVEKVEKRIKHFLVSGGTPPPNGWNHLINVCKEIREISNKLLYAMFSPPPNLSIIDEFVDAGVNEIGINLELFNRGKAKIIMPGKSSTSLDEYLRVLEYSVKLLGKNGNVRSVLIVGLENPEDTLHGVEVLASRGIMPILSVFKPIRGTLLENKKTPSKDLLFDIWYKSQKICESYSLTLGPICICCQSNTLTIPINNKYHQY